LFDNIRAALAGDEPVAEPVRKEIAEALACADEGELVIAEGRLQILAHDHPDEVSVFVALGEVRARRGDDEGAVEAYGRAVDRNKAIVSAWLGLGEALARLGRNEPARDALRRVLSLSREVPLRARAHVGRAQLASQLGRTNEALRELRKAAEAAPADANIAGRLGQAMLAAGEPEAWRWLVHAAQAWIESGQRGDDAVADLIVQAGRSCPEARVGADLLRQASGGTWDDRARVRVQAAWAERLAEVGDVEEAAAQASQALSQGPSQPAAVAAWRAVAERRGDFAQALQAAAREAELGAPPSADVLLRLALGAQDVSALEHAYDALHSEGHALTVPLRRLLDGAATSVDVLELAPFAPTLATRRWLAQTLSPGTPPTGGVFALLGFARDLASRTPEWQSLLGTAVHASEAVDRPLLVAVMGEFNAGKSSFVNALCGADVARVGVTPTTATINVLRHGPAGGRVVYQDGRAEELATAEVPDFLARLDPTTAASVRVVEIFDPLPILRRMEIVDTPGTNSLLPEHEKTAREFLIEADAVVWVFSAAQAAKASERGALDLARAVGKRVLGVLNKADQVDAAELPALQRYVLDSLGAELQALTPLSAREALAALRTGDETRRRASGLPAVLEALDERFLQHARALKQATAHAALLRFVEEARTRVPEATDACDDRAKLTELDQIESTFKAALASERLALAANLDESFRRAAAEVLLLAQPRRWPLADDAAAAHQDFLLDLLDEAITLATETSKNNLLAAASSGPPLPIAALIDRFRAFARGMLAGGVVERFLRESVPRTSGRAEHAATALARQIPDCETELFAPLAAESEAAFRAARAVLEQATARREMQRLLDEERLHAPLRALTTALREL
jgi:tetratricopeptide (TPR) repeat protein/GTP-binding protein EngB required for normal cell division